MLKMLLEATVRVDPFLAQRDRRLGWRQFTGDVFAEQPEGRVRFDVMTAFVFDMRLSPQGGAVDLCGLPW